MDCGLFCKKHYKCDVFGYFWTDGSCFVCPQKILDDCCFVYGNSTPEHIYVRKALAEAKMRGKDSKCLKSDITEVKVAQSWA